MRKHGGYIKRGPTAIATDVCNKCGKAAHFIGEYPILKDKNTEYQMPGGDKDKRRYLVLEKRKEKLQLTMS